MTQPFEPIAVIATSCLLPGCESPEVLWAGVRARRDWVAEGYTRLLDDAERFDPAGLLLPADELVAHDPVFRWALAGAREALRRAKLLPGETRREGTRGGLVMGNLMLPTRELVAYSGGVWLGGGRAPTADPRSRFSAGLPPLVVARALGLELGGLALDTACASSLYALKLACDRLHRREADWMLAGAVSHADDLILAQALGAVQVLSPTRQSRPFHQDADGLVRSEGAAFVVLRRLEAAVAGGDEILGVIRGIGLGNSGRTRALLMPSERGHVEAMRAAYAVCGLVPADVSLLECHATGNALSDLIELRSLRRLWGDGPRLPIGSLRSNLGHPITASGFASLIKVLGAMHAGIRPATLHADEPVREVERSGCRVLQVEEPWDVEGPRRAGINSFGFGGNNAHVVVEQWDPQSTFEALPLAPTMGDIAVVGLGARVADGVDVADFWATLTAGPGRVRPRPDGTLSGHAERVPTTADAGGIASSELAEALPQQLMMLGAAIEAMASVRRPAGLREGVMIGLQCDPNGARSAFREALGGASSAAAFTGRLTNLVTNRLNHHFDLRAAGWTLAAQEASGLVALDLALEALRQREADLMLVGAVDLCAEPVHERAVAEASAPHALPAGDAAVALVLKRREDALADGDSVLAVIAAHGPAGEPSLHAVNPKGPFGHAQAASGLLQVVAAVAQCAEQQAPAWVAVAGHEKTLAVCAPPTALPGWQARDKALPIASIPAHEDLPVGPAKSSSQPG